jgi:hypothetical protein
MSKVEQKPQRGVISITVGAAHGWVKPTEKEKKSKSHEVA